MQNNSKIRHTR